MNKYAKLFLWRALPECVFSNWIFAFPFFFQHHRRFPRNPVSPRATFEDYVFYRMIRSWTPFHETCVDKEYAKLVARALAPNLKITKTAAVLPISSQTTLAEVGKFLYPFLEKPFVAKPTHGSGGVVFLNQSISSIVAQTQDLFQTARKNYFFSQFEVQYRRLPRKILVEESLGEQPPSDFRFYSSRGKVLFCQFDQGRFSDHRQALFTVPDHRPISIRDQYPLPDPLPGKPPHWDEMLQIASELSKPFDFVRVDLYDLPDGVYFSEFTFTPNASILPFFDPVFNRQLLENVLQISSPGAL